MPSDTEFQESGCPLTLVDVWPPAVKFQVTESPTAMWRSAGLNSKSMTSVLQSNAAAGEASTSGVSTARGIRRRWGRIGPEA